MPVTFLIVHEPIFLFVWSDSNFLWAIPVAAYVIVAAVLLLRGVRIARKPDRLLAPTFPTGGTYTFSESYQKAGSAEEAPQRSDDCLIAGWD